MNSRVLLWLLSCWACSFQAKPLVWKVIMIFAGEEHRWRRGTVWQMERGACKEETLDEEVRGISHVDCLLFMRCRYMIGIGYWTEMISWRVDMLSFQRVVLSRFAIRSLLFFSVWCKWFFCLSWSFTTLRQHFLIQGLGSAKGSDAKHSASITYRSTLLAGAKMARPGISWIWCRRGLLTSRRSATW